MLEQSDSDSSGVEIIEVKKRQQIECCHRITQLLLHQICTKNAGVCTQKCNINNHIQKNEHKATIIQQFYQSFLNLEQKCGNDVPYYIQKLNDIQKQAIDNIANKKHQAIKQFNLVKKQIMLDTYNQLLTQYPNLYDKIKSKRYDQINCKQVYWVMNTNQKHPKLKYSQINTKYSNIMKNFQNFKEVSANIKQTKMVTNKQSAKNAKISDKMQQPKIKVVGEIKKPDYSADISMKLRNEIQSLQQSRNKLNKQITDYQVTKQGLQKKLRQLSNHINNKLFLNLNKKQRKLTIVNKTININIQFHSRKQPQNLQNMNNNSGGLFNFINIFKTINNQNKRQSQRLQQPHSNNRQEQQIFQQQNIQQQKNNQDIIRQFNKENRQVEEQNNNHENMQNQQQAQKQNNQSDNPSVNHHQSKSDDKNPQNQLNSKTNNQSISKQPIVKVQYAEEHFQPWRNKELLQQMRKSGKNQEDSLKVQNIDVLRTFLTVHLKPPKTMINPLLKKTPYRGQVNTKKPHSFNLYAMQLLAKEQLRKNQNSTQKQKK